MSEQITVAAEAVQLQADKADTHTEITADMVKKMPLPGYRNYQSLINLYLRDCAAAHRELNLSWK